MSYNLVEIEIDRLADAIMDVDSDAGNLEQAFDAACDLFTSMQHGMERHIEECRGVVEALRDARAKLGRAE